MANRRLSMRKIKEVLRLSYQGGLSARQVARSLNISRSAVKEYQERANKAGLAWPLPDTLSEQELEQKLFPPLLTIEAPAKALPDFEYIYQELKTHKKFNLTLDLLWQEYKNNTPRAISIRSSVSSTAATGASSITRCARITAAEKNSSSITARAWNRRSPKRLFNQD